MKRKKFMKPQEIELPITELSLEEFKKIIDSGLVDGEVPFDMLAEHYPELLEEWYPGYPGDRRFSTPTDPFPVRALIKDRKMTLEIPGMKDSIPLQENVSDGNYYVWIKRDKDQKFSVYGIYNHLNAFAELVVDTASSYHGTDSLLPTF